MSFWRLVLANLRHFRRAHLGVLLGAAIAAAVLVGALAVGDSVQLSLRAQAAARIGAAELALVAPGRSFREALAGELETELPGAIAAPALRLSAVAALPDGRRRAGEVALVGVDHRFFALAPGPAGPPPLPGAGEVLLNERLAHQLDAGVGAIVVLRAERPGAMPRDAMLASLDEASIALRARVVGVVTAAGYGRFGLAAEQLPPSNAFVSLAWLQSELEMEGRANLALLGGAGAGADLLPRAEAALGRRFELGDGELELRRLPSGEELELRSSRVFLDPAVCRALETLELPVTRVFTYLVNELRHGERATPYSMVTGLAQPEGLPRPAAPIAPRTAGAIAINSWLAKDLAAGVGDTVALRFFALDERRQLVEREAALRVSAVVPLDGLAADRELMPAFPGIDERASCRDWDPGIPIDLGRIRPQDETWWEERRGTPKAFVNLASATALWGDERFGWLTAARVPAEHGAALVAALRERVPPAALGLYFRELRAPAMAASAASTDFGGLFLGLSSFLIAAALLLTGLLFGLGVEQRTAEIGALLATGWRPSEVRRLFLAEGALLALAGGALGALGGTGYTRALLAALSGIWSEAVAQAAIDYHARWSSVALGAAIAVLAALAAIWFVLRRLGKRPAIELLASRGGVAAWGLAGRRRSQRRALILAVLAALGAAAVALGAGSPRAAGAFFGAGALLLIAALALCRMRLLGRVRGGASALRSPRALAMGNAARRPGRSLAAIALLACGSFLVTAVAAFHKAPPADPARRDCGTGGFALLGRSSLPLLVGRGSADDLDPAELPHGARVVPLRVRAGDDASCRNLNLPQNPRLLGVQPDLLAERGAFAFAQVLEETDASPWELLGAAGDAVPAIADQATVTWSLHESLGGVLRYRDERGEEFAVRIVATLAGSILQGDLLIDELRFQARFPARSGYRMFLVDAPADRAVAVAEELMRTHRDAGLELQSTAQRLAELNAVQNAYLVVFFTLGGLGLLLGSAGVGTLVLRNVLERRGELGVLLALGWSRAELRRLLFQEHGALLLTGLVCGALAAALAVLPALLVAGRGVSAGALLLPLAAVAAGGSFWIWLATRLALRGALVEELAEE